MNSRVKTAASSCKEIKRVERRCKQQAGRVARGPAGVASRAPYNTASPASGPHYVQTARAGYFDGTLPDETLVPAVPWPEMDALIALMSVRPIDKLISLTEAEITEFINAFRLAALEPDAP